MQCKVFFLLTMLFSTSAIGQPPLKSFSHLIEKANHFLECYDHLHPFDEYTLLKDLPINDRDLKEIYEYLIVDSLITDQKDSVETIYLIGYFQEKVLDSFHEILMESGRMVLLKNIKKDYLEAGLLSIAYSDDQKLFNISLDEKTGGTYRSRISMMYFTDIEKGGNVNDEIVYGLFTGDGFNTIHNIIAKKGTKYVLTGSVRGCSTCFETSVMLVQFVDGAFVLDFEYSVVSRDYDSGVYYDEKNRTIEIAYVTDDLTTVCDCVAESTFEIEEDTNEETDEDIAEISCACKFEFNGSNFELVKASWEKMKD